MGVAKVDTFYEPPERDRYATNEYQEDPVESLENPIDESSPGLLPMSESSDRIAILTALEEQHNKLPMEFEADGDYRMMDPLAMLYAGERHIDLFISMQLYHHSRSHHLLYQTASDAVATAFAGKSDR